MTTIKTAKQLVNTIQDNFDENSRWSLQGCEFNICDGILGYVHPVVGWFQVWDFKGRFNQGGTAQESIQWVLNEYGNEYTFQILDHAEYSHQELGTYISQPRKCGDHFIGTCREREVVQELEKEGVIKILSVDPLQ